MGLDAYSDTSLASATLDDMSVLFEDDDIIVVSKPPHILSHPSRHVKTSTKLRIELLLE
mgnify:CR=1 FL=1